ncbi:hypothetical protein [Methylopila sp. M107]|uniref:hypothetical protein n=1 Tax=Methylopila sp. M107 TaxID=1101190 RepID=UPI0003800F70|nr:hypothetical protein [Methylopila sp. M107]
MRSLVGLFGRAMPAGGCRDAFADLAARFEALEHGDDADLHDDQTIEIDFGALAQQVLEVVDPLRRHAITIETEPVRVTAGSAAPMRQILAEMTIALVRRGLASGTPGSGLIAISTDGQGHTVFRVAARDILPDAAPEEVRDVGWSLAEGLAGRLGATLARSPSQPLAIEARIPPSDDGR